jgi:hypothetical protein
MSHIILNIIKWFFPFLHYIAKAEVYRFIAPDQMKVVGLTAVSLICTSHYLNLLIRVLAKAAQYGDREVISES